MTVLFWTRPARRRDGTHYDQATKRHVSIDGTATVCGYDIPQSATVMAVTPDWHELTTCYNCAYRLWPDHAPPGYVRPVSGSDFPPRRECPHHPGHGRDPRSCATCTPPAAAAVRLAGAPAARRAPRDPGHPAPDVIRRWHIPLPRRPRALRAGGQDPARGELASNEYEGGVMHAACSDPPYPEQPDSLAARAAGSDHPDPPASGDTAAAGDPFDGTEFIVLELDPRGGKVSVLTSRRTGLPYTGYSDINRDDAVQDAREAADRARASGLPLRYTVVRIATQEVFPPTA